MRITLDPNQLGFFFRNGYLDVELPVKGEDCRSISRSLCELVRLRLSHSTPNLSSLQLLFGGRDLWRESQTLHHVIRKGPLAQLVASLWWSHGGVRLLYDQLIPFTSLTDETSGNSFFRSLHEGSFTLSGYSAFSDILGGLALCLESNGPEEIPVEVPKASSHFFPVRVGTVLCFSETCRIRFPYGEKGDSALWYLVVFGKERSRYVLNEKDPHGHRPKGLGYFLNDFLTSDRNPFIQLPSLF
ncbi:hypothetical protein [Candidatus Similichlamydia laticola]|uniref:Uncharacterized protein n=1 Tax=Candidatus Similichlamydia laticola TaxID=2170265 RepID=A0A369KHT3_9BACT|nr:hypothetical protein [Candidatus Similichlamydia laticola]RDB31353.1 hypothetical protein HAT2_00542 [Candidatus Similichlamydia laticola]